MALIGANLQMPEKRSEMFARGDLSFAGASSSSNNRRATAPHRGFRDALSRATRLVPRTFATLLSVPTSQALAQSLSASTLTSQSSISGVSGTVSQLLPAKLGERLSAMDFGASPTATSDPFSAARQRYSTAGGGVLYLPSVGTKGWNVDSYGTPQGMSFEVDGPSSDANRLLGLGPGTQSWGKAWSAVLPSSNNQGVTAYNMEAVAPGSGSATIDQTTLVIKATKQNVQNPSSVNLGGLGGMNINVYNGAPTGHTNDTYAYNTFVQVGYASGFAVIGEDKIQEHCQDGYNLCYQLDHQLGVENSASGAHIGENWTADLGVHQALFRAVGSTAGGNQTSTQYQNTGVTGRWTNVILNQLDGITNYQLLDTGAVVTASDGSPATQIIRSNLAGTETVSNGNGRILYTLDQAGNLRIPGNLYVQGINLLGNTGPLTASAGLSVSGGALIDGGAMFENNGLYNLQYGTIGLAWNASKGGGEADIVVPGDAGGPNGFSVYQEGKSDTANSAVKVWGVDGQGNVAVSGNEVVKGAIQPGSSTTASLPKSCTPGQMLYATDALKAGETTGSGSGAPVICTPQYKNGPWVWFSMFSGTLVER